MALLLQLLLLSVPALVLSNSSAPVVLVALTNSSALVLPVVLSAPVVLVVACGAFASQQAPS